jgi:carbonic anhydrase
MRRAFTADRIVGRPPRRLNRRPAAAYRPVPSVVPARRLAVLACMDCRIDVDRALGLRPGDAHMIRNAGAIVDNEVLRSLRISQELGTTDVIVLGHSDCRAIGDQTPREAVAGAVDRIRRSSIPRTGAVRGVLLDVAAGTVTDVAA